MHALVGDGDENRLVEVGHIERHWFLELLEELEAPWRVVLAKFKRYFESIAHPFRWKVTRVNLNALIARMRDRWAQGQPLKLAECKLPRRTTMQTARQQAASAPARARVRREVAGGLCDGDEVLLEAFGLPLAPLCKQPYAALSIRSLSSSAPTRSFISMKPSEPGRVRRVHEGPVSRRGASAGDGAERVRHASGEQPNWVPNHRVKALCVV
jgi:hypothetical protein